MGRGIDAKGPRSFRGHRRLQPWPRSGMTRNGIAYQRAPLVPLTGATASGLLPTPNARDGKDLSRTTAFLSAMTRHSPSIATEALAAGVGWQNVAPLYEIAMGYAPGWTDLASKPSETPLSPKSPNSSDAQSYPQEALDPAPITCQDGA